jgi:phosphoribosylglycinamide formyltransferase 1
MYTMEKPKLLIFASGSKEGGGSGFENLVLKAREGTLNANIVAVVSNHEHGGIREKADRLDIPFINFTGPWTAKEYQTVVRDLGAEFVALSGWLKLIKGLNPKNTFNIHPGPLPRFGGKGMYGHFVHEAVIEAFKKGQLTHTQICMHFVTEKYDEGPVFFRLNIPISKDDTAESLGKRVNIYEHKYQPKITNLVINKKIKWDGKNPKSLSFPADYRAGHVV